MLIEITEDERIYLHKIINHEIFTYFPNDPHMCRYELKLLLEKFKDIAESRSIDE